MKCGVIVVQMGVQRAGIRDSSVLELTDECARLCAEHRADRQQQSGVDDVPVERCGQGRVTCRPRAHIASADPVIDGFAADPGLGVEQVQCQVIADHCAAVFSWSVVCPVPSNNRLMCFLQVTADGVMLQWM